MRERFLVRRGATGRGDQQPRIPGASYSGRGSEVDPRSGLLQGADIITARRAPCGPSEEFPRRRDIRRQDGGTFVKLALRKATTRTTARMPTTSSWIPARVVRECRRVECVQDVTDPRRVGYVYRKTSPHNGKPGVVMSTACRTPAGAIQTKQYNTISWYDGAGPAPTSDHRPFRSSRTPPIRVREVAEPDRHRKLEDQERVTFA